MKDNTIKAPHKKRLLFVITKSNWGGAQKYVYDLATNTPRSDFEIAVAVGGTGEHNAKKGILADRLEEASIQTFFIHSFMRNIKWLGEIRTLYELFSLFLRERPDIVHLNSSKAGGIGALAARIARVPHIIFTVHGLPHFEDRNMFVRSLIWTATWITFLLCHRVITVSSQNFVTAKSFPFCSNKIALIHIGLSPGTSLSREESRTFLKLPTELPVVGGIGELTRNKGWKYLIDASKILLERGHQFIICIISAGEDREKLEEQVIEHGLQNHVVLSGVVLNASTYLNAFDIFVLPSVKEGLPYVILEAGHAKLSVVASDIDGIKDIIQHGTHGLLSRPKDPHGLATHIETLLTNSITAEKLGSALHNRVNKIFSYKEMLEKTIMLYQS